MLNSNNHIEKSRLGRLLVNRGYITERQLDAALAEQRASGVKLGEILIAQGLITEKDLNRTLKHQSRYRYAAAFVAVVVTPIQPLVAFAASPVVQAGSNAEIQIDKARSKGLQPLDDVEMSSIAAQGIQQDVQNLYDLMDEQGNPDGVKALKSLTKIMFPIWQVLDADVSMEGVHYDTSRARMLITEDGGFNVQLPSLIEEVRIENIRVAGATAGPDFGSLLISGIQFSDQTSLVIRPN